MIRSGGEQGEQRVARRGGARPLATAVLAAVTLVVVMLAAAPAARAGGTVLFSTTGGISPTSSTITSQHFTDVAGSFETFAADDFTVPADEAWTITGAEFQGAYVTGTGPPTGINVYILGDDGGLPDTTSLPGGAIFSGEDLSFLESAAGVFSVPLPSVELDPGTYWLIGQVEMPLATGGQWGVKESSDVPETGTKLGAESAWMQDATTPPFPGSPCQGAWGARITDCGFTQDVAPFEFDLAFELSGDRAQLGLIFTDGFESGNTSRWSLTVP